MYSNSLMRHFEVWPAQSYSGKHFICREFAADKCKSDKATEFQACRRCCKISGMSPFVKSPPSFKRKVTSKTYFEIMCHSEIRLHAIFPYILLETTSSSWLFRNPLCNMTTWESWTSLSLSVFVVMVILLSGFYTLLSNLKFHMVFSLLVVLLLLFSWIWLRYRKEAM